MLHNSVAILVFLLIIEIAALALAQRFHSWFQILPSIFWIYFLPMLASTMGIIDSKSPIYKSITEQLLPASLFLLLISVDIRSIWKLGKTALMMFFAGTFGIMLGAPLVFFIFKRWIGVEFWSGFGAISASWTGGSANMIAVKEALATPDAVFLPMVIVDTIVPYVWMGILAAIVSLQPVFDRWNRSKREVLEELNQKMISAPAQNQTLGQRIVSASAILIMAALASWLAQTAAKGLPVIKDVISPYAWTIVVVSALGIIFSFTPLRKLEAVGSTRIGYFILYFVLTSIGAKASLTNIGSTLILIAAGFLLVLIHAVILLFVARLIRAPLFLVAVASQANIGGVASAPVVAEIYQPGLASVGLLLAILGNIIGTYVGILTAQLCRMVMV